MTQKAPREVTVDIHGCIDETKGFGVAHCYASFSPDLFFSVAFNGNDNGRPECKSE